MKKSRLRTLITGLAIGTAYAYLSMFIVTDLHESVSISYIFILPVILGAIPVLFSTKEQLKAYRTYLIWPWVIVFTFFILAYLTRMEGMICLVIIVGPFLLLGTLGAFITRLIKLKREGKGTKLYFSLFLPLLVLCLESDFKATDQIHSVTTSMEINAERFKIWGNIKNVKDIKSDEIEPHFIHLIGIPKPLNGELDKDGIGGVRHITWEKGIKFDEKITGWDEGNGFTYDINVNPHSISPKTLDEHVMIGGRYFDVLKGSYRIDSLAPDEFIVTLSCTYRVTTNLNWYSKLWADYILNDFNDMILEVIKKRCEKIR